MSKSYRVEDTVLRAERTQREAANRVIDRESKTEVRCAMRAGSATAATQEGDRA